MVPLASILSWHPPEFGLAGPRYRHGPARHWLRVRVPTIGLADGPRLAVDRAQWLFSSRTTGPMSRDLDGERHSDAKYAYWPGNSSRKTWASRAAR